MEFNCRIILESIDCFPKTSQVLSLMKSAESIDLIYRSLTDCNSLETQCQGFSYQELLPRLFYQSQFHTMEDFSRGKGQENS